MSIVNPQGSVDLAMLGMLEPRVGLSAGKQNGA